MDDVELEGVSAAVVRTIREPLLILDPELRVRAANPAFYGRFLTDAESTVGRLLFELGDHQWDIPPLRELLETILPRDASVEGFEVEHDFPGIGRRFMVLNARRLEREDGRRPLILLAIQDVTAQVEAQRELRRSNQELERFAYVASHDLQEPLRMVASYTRLLARRYEGRLDERADKYIGYAVEGAERMKSLIQDLLAFSRVGTQGGDAGHVDADELLDRVLEDFRLKVQEQGARITRDPLPAVWADPAQLRQLLQNLIDNAIKFSGDGPPVIHVSGRSDGSMAEFSVRDEGVGVDPEYFERIFVIFQRLHGRDTEGTGIGLALCRRIVERHGGRIWIESRPGEGSTFHFTLPSSEAP